jgi:hypothetical protein
MANITSPKYPNKVSLYYGEDVNKKLIAYWLIDKLTDFGLTRDETVKFFTILFKSSTTYGEKLYRDAMEQRRKVLDGSISDPTEPIKEKKDDPSIEIDDNIPNSSEQFDHFLTQFVNFYKTPYGRPMVKALMVQMEEKEPKRLKSSS